MIIRLLRGMVPIGQEAHLVERLRRLDLDKAPPAGFVGVTLGVRRTGDSLGFLALSTWTSIEAIAAATSGLPDQALPSQPAGRALESVAIDLFEVPEGPPLPVGVDRGGALGIVWARVAPHAEAAAHEMIRAVGPEVGAAGVAGIHVGRRVVDDQTELVVVASWRDRLALHEFAQHRARGTLDPAFLELMTEWRFETYDCVVAGTVSVPPAGPAVLLADDQARYIDASPGIETLIGLPAELVLRQSLADLRRPPSGRPPPSAGPSSSPRARHRARSTSCVRTVPSSRWRFAPLPTARGPGSTPRSSPGRTIRRIHETCATSSPKRFPRRSWPPPSRNRTRPGLPRRSADPGRGSVPDDQARPRGPEIRSGWC